MGTVHKFQGKEADEVIFVLGADSKQKDKYAVTGFVNSNMVNVAATRAKYRLYIVGDSKVWEKNSYITEAKAILDTYALEEIVQIRGKIIPEEEKKKLLLKTAAKFPDSESFCIKVGEDSIGELIYDSYADLERFVGQINKEGFLQYELTDDQYQEFGFAGKEDMQQLSGNICSNLVMAIKIYSLLKPLFQLSDELDAACCGILFCKCMEYQVKENLQSDLKELFSNYSLTISGKTVELGSINSNQMTLGTVNYILSENVAGLSDYMLQKSLVEYDEDWWTEFIRKMVKFAEKRNQCCHPHRFKWEDLMELPGFEFKGHQFADHRQMQGVFFACTVGKNL